MLPYVPGDQMANKVKNSEESFSDENVDGEEICADEGHSLHYEADEGIQD